jgi:hypothetical protein
LSLRRTSTKLWILLAVAVPLILLLAILLGGPLLRSMTGEAPRTQRSGESKTPGGVPGPAGGGGQVPAVLSGPSYLGIPLTGKRIVISIDAGASFDGRGLEYALLGVRQACQSLADDQSLKLGLWQEEGVKFVPEKGFAKRGEFDPIFKALDDASAQGATATGDSVSASLKTGCDQLIIVTAKPVLDPSVRADDMLKSRQMNQRIDVIRVLSPGAESVHPLEELTDKANGRFVSVDQGQMATLTKQ